MLQQVYTVETPGRLGSFVGPRRMYSGSKEAMQNYSKYVQMFSTYCIPTVAMLREFTGSDPHDFSRFVIKTAE